MGIINIFNFEDFDHTAGCYISDYVLGTVVLITSIIFILINRCKKGKKAFINQLWIVVCTFLFFLYALLGGLVHHKFLDNSNQKKWSLVWIAGSAIGLPSFTMLGCISYMLYFPTNKVFWIIYPIVLVIGFIIQWFIPDAFMFLMVCAGIMLVFMIIVSSIAFYLTKFYSYRFVLSGILIIILATVLQLSHISFDKVHFNYNTLYHTVMAIGAIVLITGFSISEPDISNKVVVEIKNRMWCKKRQYSTVCTVDEEA